MSGVYIHRPVMLKETLAALQPRSGGRYFDGTLGGAGHARAILEASAPDGFLYGSDLDPRAIEEAKRRLEPFAGRWEIRQGNFYQMDEWVPQESCDGILLDLGVSSALLEDAQRGFSFERDGPLDMRMNPEFNLTAADVVNNFSADELESIFREFGDVEGARKIALEIVNARRTTPISSTVQLAKLIERTIGWRKKQIHPATLVFMALRIYVNDEFGSLKRGLDAALKTLKPGGRLAVITFHSGEDRIVKNFGREKAKNYTVIGEVDLPEFREPKKPELKIVYKKPAVPSLEEIRENPRARSAKLRVFEKI
ncbi:MAG: 16S rRNA (cytosine(1402)-N(4))-methyltransferase RsmH [Verrucomicrobiae bacterium]|nr:16S rRNA (cytosine(1402)-N(4))-methyltransferase RsmH [Verrucomicrobiae bacterium]